MTQLVIIILGLVLTTTGLTGMLGKMFLKKEDLF